MLGLKVILNDHPSHIRRISKTNIEVVANKVLGRLQEVKRNGLEWFKSCRLERVVCHPYCLILALGHAKGYGIHKDEKDLSHMYKLGLNEISRIIILFSFHHGIVGIWISKIKINKNSAFHYL